MAEPGQPPHEISYDDVCRQTGKLYIESQYEIHRLSAMLMALQEKYISIQAENTKLKEELEQVRNLNTIYENMKSKT